MSAGCPAVDGVAPRTLHRFAAWDSGASKLGTEAAMKAPMRRRGAATDVRYSSNAIQRSNRGCADIVAICWFFVRQAEQTRCSSIIFTETKATRATMRVDGDDDDGQHPKW